MTKPTIVLTAAVPWDGVIARPQHFARELCRRGWNVLFVDGPITWLSPLKRREYVHKLLPKQAVKTIPMPEGSGTLRVLTTVAGIPFSNMYRPLNKFNQWVFAKQIQAAAPGPYVLLPMIPNSVDLIPHLHPLAVLYDCVDYHSEFPGYVDALVVDQMEADLVHLSRTVFATADALRDRMSLLHADVHLVMNAAEVAHFQTAARKPVHHRLQEIPGPRIGFIGGIGSWVDLEWIQGIAKLRPEIQIVMIGPVETDVSILEGVPNVHFLGRQPYHELPEFLAGFDATLVSFTLSPLAQSVNPVKVYEYIAAGKEVISTPLREIQKLDKQVWIAPTSEDAIQAIDRILSGERKLTDVSRGEFIRGHSWDARVDVVEDAIRSVVPMSLESE